MNERIKQLAIQADIKFLEFHGKEYCEAWVEQQEKFAELIVQECAKVILETPVKYTEIDIMHVIRDRVKQHFEVT